MCSGSWEKDFVYSQQMSIPVARLSFLLKQFLFRAVVVLNFRFVVLRPGEAYEFCC